MSGEKLTIEGDMVTAVEPKHTPGPWFIGRNQTRGNLVWIDSCDAPSEGIADLYHRYGIGEEEFVVKTNAEANAAFIVQACNAHDGLVAALRDAIDSLEYVERMHPGFSGYGVRQERIAAARAALAAGTMTAPTAPPDTPPT